MNKGSFGELLKRERELREVTLNEVTVATRIPPRFLEAFEREDWEKLPGGVFNRGFVRAIARYLGLDEENLLSEYDLAYGEQRALRRRRSLKIRFHRLQNGPSAGVAIAILLLLVGAIWGSVSRLAPIRGASSGEARSANRLGIDRRPQLRQRRFRHPAPYPPPDANAALPAPQPPSANICRPTREFFASDLRSGPQLPEPRAPRPRRLHLRPRPVSASSPTAASFSTAASPPAKSAISSPKTSSSSPPPTPPWCCWS